MFVPLLTLFTILEEQVKDLIFQITLSSAIVLGLLVGKILGSPEAALFFMSVSGALVYISFGSNALMLAGVPGKKIAETWLRELVILCIGLTVFFVVLEVINTLTSTISHDGIFEVGLCVLYVGITLSMSRKRFNEFNNLATQAFTHDK